MIFFWIKESFRLIGTAKSSFFLSLMSMSISLALIYASVFSINFSNYLQNKLKRSVNINVFLNDTVTKNDINNLKKKIKTGKDDDQTNGHIYIGEMEKLDDVSWKRYSEEFFEK